MRNRGMVALLAGLALAPALVACSGGGSKGSTGPGTSQADDLDTDAPDPSAKAGDPANPCSPDNPCAAGDAGAGEAPGVDPNAPLVTFELHNSHDVDIEFSYEKGWGLIVSGYSGKPPKAKPIFLFPRACVASCDSAEEERCPVCEAPKGVKEEKEAEQRQVVKSGESHKLPWDGQVYAYEKTRGLQGTKKKRCQCFNKAPVEPAMYTLRACGIRVTKSAKKTSKFQCVTTEVELPPAEPTTIKFDFGKP